jgi:hypothetical protein
MMSADFVVLAHECVQLFSLINAYHATESADESQHRNQSGMAGADECY